MTETEACVPHFRGVTLALVYIQATNESAIDLALQHFKTGIPPDDSRREFPPPPLQLLTFDISFNS